MSDNNGLKWTVGYIEPGTSYPDEVGVEVPSDEASGDGKKKWTLLELSENPEQLVVDLLSLVCVTVSEKQVEGWTEEQRERAVEWACATHLSASDNDDVEVPPRPAFLDEVSGG